MNKNERFIYQQDLEAYINLYNKIPKITELNPVKMESNKEYRHLMLSKGLPSGICHVEKYLDEIPMDKDLYSFYGQAQVFWMIPLETINGQIYGFIYRSYTGKLIRTISFSEISVLYGFQDFKDFVFNKPIIIVEGWRDALFIKQFYKYCLALNTSTLNSGTLELISRLTNKVVIILDNDTTGRIQSKRNKDLLESKGVYTTVVTPDLKDLGEYLDNNTYVEKIKIIIYTNIKKLMSF